MNEPDAYALEEALRLKEKHGGEVVVVLGRPGPRAAGAFARRWRAAPTAPSTSRTTRSARPMRSAVADAPGRRDAATSSSTSSSPACSPTIRATPRSASVLAERLGMPHSTIIMEVQVAERRRCASSASSKAAGSSGVTMPLPALLTIQSGINQLRYATLKGIMAAKKKEIRKVVAAGAPAARAQQIVSRCALPQKSKQTRHDRRHRRPRPRKELVRRLREEARVL